MGYEARLRSLGLTLPIPPKPVALYVPAVRCGNLLFLSGALPFVNGKLAFRGRVGVALTLAQGKAAARIALLNALAVIAAECGGLDAVKRIVRMGVYVASPADFTEHPAVANGASELLVDLFGDAGRHARIAVGTLSLPLDAPVEIELIVQSADEPFLTANLKS